jgi:pimeloyl-ACP methyl ester carboxylesterase
LSKEELLQSAIAAARSGDREKAAALFAQLVKLDPSSEQGWLGLGFCCAAQDQREYCFRRVLSINPNNSTAHRQLDDLLRQAPVSRPGPIPSQSPQKSVQPFATEAYPSPKLPEQKPPPVVEKKPLPPSMPQASVPDARPVTVAPAGKRKSSNRNLIAILIAAPIFIVCFLGIGYLILMRQASLITPALVSFLTPTHPSLQTDNQTSQTATATIVSTPLPPTALPTALPTVSYAARFEESSCPFDQPGEASVKCGHLIVPEDRAGDPNHTIRLAVAIYHSTSSNPAPDPVLFLQGGPGAEAVKLSADAYDVLVQPFLSERDFITFDQRGTGLSDPSLQCDELTKLYQQDIHGLIPGSTRKLVYSNAFLACNGLMLAKGIKLNAYTTVASAADVRDLLGVLGIKKVDLFGASYGTRLAQVIMRDYPDIVQSAILDSVVPIQTNIFNEFPKSNEHALRTLFDRCQADPKCNAAYPDLEKTFWNLVEKLDDKPVSITTSSYPNGVITESVDGTNFMSVILGLIKQAGLIGTAPQTIYRFRDGDYSTFIVTQSSLPFEFEGISPGLYISMMCHEHILATTLDEHQASDTGRANVNGAAWLPFYGDASDLYKACKSWDATGPVYGENDPVVSNIPTLIITGSFDPATPPNLAQEVAAELGHAYYFEFSNQGHTPTGTDESGCAIDTVLAFLHDPDVEPDRACLDKLKPVDFQVPYTGTPALELKTRQAGGMTVRLPKDWYSFEDGFYSRGTSPLDITQVSAFEIPGSSSSDVEAWFSSKLNGYSGLDGPLNPVGNREANGLSWKLFISSSYGRPVDIAVADYRGRSLVLMMFCNNDEHDALYRTVFLAMVDSAEP